MPPTGADPPGIVVGDPHAGFLPAWGSPSTERTAWRSARASACSVEAVSIHPADSHVHTEWSWDTSAGSMERTCARAVELGLPAVAFTEHVDHTRLNVPLGSPFEDDHGHLIAGDRTLAPPALDVDGYLECIERCRSRFSSLRIISGMELGEPHWHAETAAKLLSAGQFDRVLGSLHAMRVGADFFEPMDAFPQLPAADVLRSYLDEAHRLIVGSDVFSVLAHIDYAVRSWPAATAGPFEPAAFEEEFRVVLRALAQSGRALEVNTRLPLDPTIVAWWADEGGEAVTFGSDAHEPAALAHGLREAAAMVETFGFHAGRHPYDVWHR
jgi:histidinol-phosphatase (PHP family)